MKIKSFDRTNVRLLSQEIEATLKTLAEKYGITLKTGRGTFRSDNFTLKLEAAVIGDNGQAVTKEVSEFQNYAALLGLQPDDLGKPFTLRGQTYIITGAKLSSRKYPVLAKNTNGKVYKFTAEDVKRGLGR